MAASVGARSLSTRLSSKMRSSFAFLAAFVGLAAAAATPPPTAAQIDNAKTILSGRRTTSLLSQIPGLIPFPQAAANDAALPFNDIQGDILAGMKKNKQSFYFFSIQDPKKFKLVLKTLVAPFLTSTKQLMNVTTQPIVALNVAFSQSGLTKLGITDNLGDAEFTAGQFADAAFLGDPGTGNWKPAFRGTKIHGVFLMASDKQPFVDLMKVLVTGVFFGCMKEEYTLDGNVRPGAEAGHEMFGYLDGIAQPSIPAFQAPFPGQQVIDPGVLLLNTTGDPIQRPSWTKFGSFLAFRQLQQLVPEFDGFVKASAPAVPGLTAGQSADLLGARMIGRWKSGAPVDLFPLTDGGSAVGNDPFQNNNFDFQHAGFNFTTDQTHCPFDAHIRKTRPRADLVAPANSIMRSGIPYGPEVTPAEKAAGRSDPADGPRERGLAFVSYQAQIAKGFRFLQHSWANNPGFVFNKDVDPGHDPIIGALAGAPRTMAGFNAADTSQSLNLPTDWVVSRGGEYFFSPSISSVKNVICA